MSHENFDVIVAGLGAMGSATACHLALRGCHVLGLDRWAPGHTMGSSHGESRIIRELYYERPIYVPLVQRAYELWRDLEARTGRTLLYETSGLMIGPPTGDLITGARRSGSTYHLPYEVLSANELHRRFPAFTLPDGYVALLDPHAGYLTPEACVDAHLQIARAHGAMLRFEEPVVDWSAHEGGIQVVTPRGIYAAGRLVINAGAYGRALLANLDLPLTVERQTLFWFEVSAAGARYDAPSFPIYMHEDEHARLCYGFPRLQRGVKAAVMHEGKIIRASRSAGPSPGSCLTSRRPPCVRARSAYSPTPRTTTFSSIITRSIHRCSCPVHARGTDLSSQAPSASSRPIYSPRGGRGSTWRPSG
jgi:sarcosine oxidase